MTAGLHPTPARLDLMVGIQNEEVHGYPYAGSDHVDYSWTYDRGRGVLTVTARVNEVMAAGWACKGKKRDEGSPTSDFHVELTEEGRKVLEAGRGA